MSAHPKDIRQALHAPADQLPENATWKDVAYKVYVRQEIEAGLSQARSGDFASANEVREAFATRLVHACRLKLRDSHPYLTIQPYGIVMHSRTAFSQND